MRLLIKFSKIMIKSNIESNKKSVVISGKINSEVNDFQYEELQIKNEVSYF